MLVDDFLRELGQQPGYNKLGLYGKDNSVKLTTKEIGVQLQDDFLMMMS